MTKGIIYYTDNRLGEPIFSVVQKCISASRLPVTSVSLRPISFGTNIVLPSAPGISTMMKQIQTALEASTADIVFFCEHDVLYPTDHFDFTPSKTGIFYYNAHVWRWKYPGDFAITYDRLLSLSGLCVQRTFALKHYTQRLAHVAEKKWDLIKSREPAWARNWGYEPGTKKKKRGGFSDDDFETWRSRYPIIDIRHGKTFSQSKVTRDSFVHPPSNWRETTIQSIQGWNLKELFNV